MALTVGELQVILDANVAAYNKGLTDAGKKSQQFAKDAGGALNSFTGGLTAALGALGGLVAGISFARLVSGLLDVAQAAQEARQTLQVAVGNVADAETVFAALAQVATDTKQSISDTVNVFDKLEQSTQNLGLSQKDLVDLTETVNNTLTLSGKSGEQANKALNAFAASIANGRIDIGAFNAALKQTPELSDAIAAGLGITQKEMLALAKAGNLTAEQVVAALQRIGPAVKEQADQLAPTFGQALQQVRNQIFVVVDAFVNGSGASSKLGKALQDLSKNLAEDLAGAIRTGIRAFAALLDAGASVIRFLESLGLGLSGLGNLFKIASNNADIFIQGLKAGFAVLKVGVLSLVVAFNAVRSSLGLISTADFQASVDALSAANQELVTTSTQAGAAIENDLLDSAKQAKAFLENKVDNRLSDSIKGFAQDARDAADAAVAAVDRIKTARGQLSTAPRGTAVPTQTAEQAAEEKAFFDRLKRGQEIEFQLDQQDRAARSKRILEERKALLQNIREFSDNLGTSVADAFRTGLENGSAGFLSGFVDSLAASAQEGLQKAFATSLSDLADGITQILSKASPAIAGIFGGGPGEAGTPTLTGRLIGGAVQIGLTAGLTALGAALKKDTVQSAAGNVQSAVNSAQQVRGIVAGPTSIAIADVARGINEAFDEPTRLLALIEKNTRQTAVNTRAGAGGGNAQADNLVANQSESLI